MLRLLAYFKWIWFALPMGYSIFKSNPGWDEILAMALIGGMGWWGVSEFLDWLVYPPREKGRKLRFKRCLRHCIMDEARDMALSAAAPYRIRMLKLAWYRFSGKANVSGYRRKLFFWLDKLTPELREKVAPGAYRRYGTSLIKTSIRNLYDWKTRRSDVDWPVAEKIGYVLSPSELKRAAKYGDQRAIEILDRD